MTQVLRNVSLVLVFTICLSSCSEKADEGSIANVAQAPHAAPISGVAASAPATTNGQRPPLELEALLKDHPEFHLLFSEDVTEEGAKQAVATHEIKPFLVADTNQDGKDDIVAVLVKDHAFNLVVLQSSGAEKPPILFWLMQDDAGPLFLGGVGRYIAVSNCWGCDNVGYFAWTGTEYASEIILQGDEVCLNSHTNIYALPKENSQIVYTTDDLKLASVVAVGSRNGQYFWHEIKLKNGKSGFVLNNSFNLEPGECEAPYTQL
jgi:hypothetical protein